MTMMDKDVLVTGASGFLGGHLSRLLAAQGRRVRAMVRRSSNIEGLTGHPIEIVYGDALDPASLREAMQGCATVFHNVVDVRVHLSDPAPMYRNNVDGAVNAMDAALACGIERFVFTSTIGTLGLNPNGLVTEDIPFNWPKVPAYIRTRKEAEDRVLQYCRDKALPGIVLCVANTYGPEDRQPTPHNGRIAAILNGQTVAAVDAGQPTVDIRDAAEALVPAERYGRIGERYIIANDYVTGLDFYATIASLAGVPTPPLIPYETIYEQARAAEEAAAQRGERDFPFTTDAMYLSKVFGPTDNGKARRELHWTPRPFRQSVADAVDWFKGRNVAAQDAA